MDKINKRKSELLAVLFGFIFLLSFIYCLVRFLCKIRLEYQKERINRRRLYIVNNESNSSNSNNLNI